MVRSRRLPLLLWVLLQTLIVLSCNSPQTNTITKTMTPKPTNRVPQMAVRQLTTISAGNNFSLAVKIDGTVVSTGDNANKQCEVSGWKDIISVDGGGYHSVGLRKDGTVVATGNNKYHQCDVSKWRNIVSVSAGDDYTVGVQKDGTVIATGNNNYRQCEVSDWVDIISVSAGLKHTVGLKKDGTAVAVGNNQYGQCNVSSWDNLVAVCTGGSFTLGLKGDGQMVFTGGNSEDVTSFIKSYPSTDLTAIAAGGPIIFIQNTGKVVVKGSYSYSYITKPKYLPQYTTRVIQSYDVSKWSSIVAISSGYNHVIGLTRSGTVVAQGNCDYGQCKVADWNNIRLE